MYICIRVKWCVCTVYTNMLCYVALGKQPTQTQPIHFDDLQQVDSNNATLSTFHHDLIFFFWSMQSFLFSDWNCLKSVICYDMMMTAAKALFVD